MALPNDEKKKKPDLSIQGQFARQAERYIGPSAGAAAAQSPADVLNKPADVGQAAGGALREVGGLAARAGQTYGRALSAPVKAVNNAGLAVADTVRNLGRGFVSGVTGNAIAAPTAPAPPPAAPNGSSYGVVRGLMDAGRAALSGMRAGVPAVGAPAAPVAAGAQPKAGDANTFTGANGNVRTIRADGSLTGTGSNLAGTQGGGTFQTAGAAPVVAGRGNFAFAPSAQLNTAAGMQVTRNLSGFDGAVAGAQAQNRATNARANQMSAESFLDPRSSNNEVLRRMTHALQGKQTASQRQATAAAYGQIIRGLTQGSQIAQQGAQGAISQENQTQGALALENARGANAQVDRRLSNEGSLAQQDLANTGALARQTQADTAAAQRGLSSREPIPLADGTAALLNADGTLAPITGADGQPAQLATSPQPGMVTPAMQYKSLGAELAVLQQFAPAQGSNERAAYDEQVGGIRARMAALEGGQSGQPGPASRPPRAQAEADVRKRNPNATDAEIKQALDAAYGN